VWCSVVQCVAVCCNKYDLEEACERADDILKSHFCVCVCVCVCHQLLFYVHGAFSIVYGTFSIVYETCSIVHGIFSIMVHLVLYM